MKLEEVRDIIKYRADSVRKITEIINASQNIRSMEQFQRKYYPKSVGIECPYCGRKLQINAAQSNTSHNQTPHCKKLP